ncbi:MAG: IS1634 family transposase, partial [Magnetococcales bacterium]|nr:IS1634 family transposase [Nitrospirota bacterium]
MTELYKSNTLDHLGLVSGMYDELGIGEVIDKTIKQDREKRIVSVGQAVKAMVLNGLGFVNKCLYLVPMFFADKPVERLIGRGICASHLNDDTLGRALDEIHEFGETELFSLIGMESTDRLSLKTRFAHLDSTSLHVDGRYNSDDAAQEGVIHITKGYSRDHRPELNQVVLDLIVENKAGIPFLMQPMSGNSNDKRTFVDVIGNHIDMLQNYHGVEYFVADSALY